MTKSESDKLADLRNKFGAVYTHFQIIRDLHELKEKDPIAHDALKERVMEIFEENEKVALESMDQIKEILDSFG